MDARVESVRLENFRGFRDHTVSLLPTTVLVGQNNAGKSTLIDALRILAIAVRRAGMARYDATPDWLDAQVIGVGYRLLFDTIDFDFTNLQYNHDRADPARLTLTYDNGVQARVWLRESRSESFAQMYHSDGGLVTNHAAVSHLQVPSIYVMPPIETFHGHEKKISKARVHEFMFGRLSARHFRNQLGERVPEYVQWKKLLDETWPGVSIVAFDGVSGSVGEELSLIVRDGPNSNEIAFVGGGLQAWMQILWFLCRAPSNGVIVLDEPDIFLHADMQRKLIKVLGLRKYRQTIVATHSSEIISDTPAETICVVRKREKRSWRPLTHSKLQSVIDSLGSRHNIQLSKLASARKAAVFEGDDQKFLSEVAIKISVSCYDRFIAVPSFQLNGVNNWHQAIGAAKVISVASESTMPVHLVVDRDFRSDTEMKKLHDDAVKFGLTLSIWDRKEVENYFVHSDAVARLISRRGKIEVTADEVEQLITEACERLTEESVGTIADRLHQICKSDAHSTVHKKAGKIFRGMVNARGARNVVSGKRLLAKLSEQSKNDYGVSFGAMAVCKEMRADEFDPYLIAVVKSLSQSASPVA
ncbi:MAG: AAA family ATPase [Sphingomonas sp.]|uniref:ATP-dependent nuclease n=1 Tax=Sphingomonas sp. TaxID=28214 RepID=UPI00182DB73C|nr:ATP-binding protein [Sphingomonas sp.]MBA3666744.1 AAA family ATPase [Sphingomonas sp.]